MIIGFFKTSRKDFLVSHHQGLNEDQVQLLHSLKVGDRLKVWVNEDKENKPRLTLDKLIDREVPSL